MTKEAKHRYFQVLVSPEQTHGQRLSPAFLLELTSHVFSLFLKIFTHVLDCKGIWMKQNPDSSLLLISSNSNFYFGVCALWGTDKVKTDSSYE